MIRLEIGALLIFLCFRVNAAPTADVEPDVQQDSDPQITAPSDPKEEGYLKNDRIKHPNAEKGLYLITRDKDYMYRVPVSPQTKAATFHLGTFDPGKLENPDTGTSFDTIYGGSSSPLILFDYEWQIFQKLGKLGIVAGSGILAATGNGRFANGQQALEKLTFFFFPTSLGVIYRLQLWDSQPIVPFGFGGIDGIVFNEFRDDNKPPFGRWGGSAAAHFGGGAAINISMLDRKSMLELDKEYGINSIWITGEYRSYVALSSRFDFSGDYVNFGFMWEF